MGCLYKRSMPFLNIFWWFLLPRKAVLKCTHLPYNYSSSLRLSKCTLIGIQSCLQNCLARGIITIHYIHTYKALWIRTIKITSHEKKQNRQAGQWKIHATSKEHWKRFGKKIFTKMRVRVREINKEWWSPPKPETAESPLSDLKGEGEGVISKVFPKGSYGWKRGLLLPSPPPHSRS